MSAFIFVSYDLRDKDHPRFKDLKKAMGVKAKPWTAETRVAPGDDLPGNIRRAIEQCCACVFLLTKDSARSAWCSAEVGAFWGVGKKVVVLKCDPDADISDVAPQFLAAKWTESTAEAWQALLPEIANASKKDAVPAEKSPDLEDILLQRLSMTLQPLERRLTQIEERLWDRIPFGENHLFGIRKNHFVAEKRVLADGLVTDLESRLEALLSGNVERIRLLLDSGTTIFPIFKLLMRKKNNPVWFDRVEIVTNNIPGVFVSLVDGRKDESNPYSKLAFRTRLVGGEPIPAFWASLAPSWKYANLDTEAVADGVQQLGRSDPKCMTIGVTTGNYAQLNGYTLLNRDRSHHAFKKALVEVSEIVYCLFPLGKMLPCSADELNESLISAAERDDPDKRYADMEIDVSKLTEFVVITTKRNDRSQLHGHFACVRRELDSLVRRHGGRARVIWIPSEVLRDQIAESPLELTAEELEMPHGKHMAFLKDRFRWGM